ncbi:MAG: hypothetical protein ACFFCX_12250 [Candidatus Sifarchaeia archaeon]
MQERKVSSGVPARIKLESESQLISRSLFSKFFRTVVGLLHVNRSLFGVRSKGAFSNAQRRKAALRSSETERIQIGLRYIRQAPLIR